VSSNVLQLLLLLLKQPSLSSSQQHRPHVNQYVDDQYSLDSSCCGAVSHFRFTEYITFLPCSIPYQLQVEVQKPTDFEDNDQVVGEDYQAPLLDKYLVTDAKYLLGPTKTYWYFVGEGIFDERVE
jgi:hypothetical protein